MPELQNNEPIRFSSLGESAVLLDAASRDLADDIQRRIWQLTSVAAHWPDVRELVPGMNNLLVIFDPLQADPVQLSQRLREAWNETREDAKHGRTIEIPVHYGGEAGFDLAFLAERHDLTIEEVVRLHSQADYLVYAIGSQPGFGYLAGLDGKLATPRREVPRKSVTAGAVMIGGAQAGVMACTSPSGWHVLGRTDVRLFDPDRSPSVLLAPGDRIRFRVESLTT
jgi:KipI family sensor histidine kinase inhibitor